MSDCKELASECPPQARSSEAWSICLPFGGRIWRVNGEVHAQGGNPPPDGTYGTITIANGCIVGVGPVEVPLYTGNPCAPLPNPCSSRAAAVAVADSPVQVYAADIDTMPAVLSDETPSLASGNLYALDPAGRPLVRCTIEAGEHIRVSGSGTVNDPFIISALDDLISVRPVYARSGNDAIALTGDGTAEKPLYINHKLGKQTAINGMTFDAYGHLIDTAPSGSVNRGIQAILPANSVEVKTDLSTGIATIGLRAPASPVTGEYLLGGVRVAVDESGRFKSLTQAIDLGGSQTVRAGTLDIDVNEFGAITAITDALNLGSAYYLAWGKQDEGSKGWLGQINLRCSTGLCGLLFGPKEFLVQIDDAECGVLFRNDTMSMIAGGGVFSVGAHTVSVTTVEAGCLVLLAATSGTLNASF